MARSFRSAASRCASADFTPFPLSAFGAMAEVVGEIDGVVVLVAAGGGALLSFGFEKKGGSSGDSRGQSNKRRSGETAPASPAYKEGGGGRFALPNKETTHDLSHDAAFNACRSWRARWIRSKIRRYPGRACSCPVLGLAQQRSAPCVAQARGLLSVY